MSTESKNPLTFAARLRKAMEHRGMNPKQLAEASGISADSIRAWLKGKRRPSPNSSYAVAGALDCPPLWLILGRESVKCPTCGWNTLSQDIEWPPAEEEGTA